ncbi:MAG: RHS repeat-associated core domain-containing protein [Myxococcaceae bacterium]
MILAKRKKYRSILLLVMSVFAGCSLWAARLPEPIYPNLWVHDHFLAQPKAAALKGSYAHFDLSTDSFALGNVSISFPLELPMERGEILHSPLPSYSRRGGYSEWGLGWETALSIYRYSEIGEVNCNGDLFASPWGKLRLNPRKDAYYLKGFEIDLQIKRNSGGFIGYHPDGRVFYFAEDYGDFAWYLKEVKDREGHVTSYVYEKNRFGRPILKSVQYGGKKHRQYEIEFFYEELSAPLQSFESCGLETTLDKIVSQVVLKSWNGQQFKIMKKVQLVHKDRYLIQVETEFPSGDKLPAVQYHYDDLERFMKAPSKPSKSNFNDMVVKDITGYNFFRTSLSLIDINQDGLIDIERSDNLKSYLQGVDGQFFFQQESSSKTADPRCAKLDWKTRRLLFRPSGPEDSLYYLLLVNDFQSRDTSTKIAVCDLDGKLRYEKQTIAQFGPGFFVKDFTHLVDLNSDLKPDLVRVAYNEYAYFLNESTLSEIKFSDVVKKPLPRMHELDAKAFFFSNMNGDRFIDLIAQTRRGLMVWYGMGNMVFASKPIYLPFKMPFNSSSDLTLDITPADLVFLDLNRDGLTDAYFYNGIVVYFFINKGNHFYVEKFYGYKDRREVFGYPTILNVNGSFDDQLLVWSLLNGDASYDLNTASTGLLTRVDNGQGIVLDFEYQWTDPKPGVPHPFIVPKSLTVNTAGKGSKKTEFEFIDPQVNLATGQLIGFSQVKTHDSQVSVQTDYVTSVEHSPRQKEIRKQDNRLADIIEVETHGWKEAVLDGISYLSHANIIQSYFTKDQTILRRLVNFLDYDRLCVNKTEEITTTGILEKLISYFDSRSCLKSNEKQVGPDFVYTTLIDYNQAGLPTNLQLATRTERLQKMALGYDKDFNLINVTQPSTGTVFLRYDPVFEILKSLHFPDGTWREMTGYSTEADAVSSLVLKSSGKTALEQAYGYDAFHRLKTISNNLGESYDYSYRLPSQTMPDVILEASAKTAVISSSDGEILTHGKLSKRGWYFDRLHRVIPAQRKEQQVDLSRFHQNPEEIKYQDLEAANIVLDETESSNKRSVIDFSHTNYITRSFEVDLTGFKTNSTENTCYVTQSVVDLSHGQPISYTDEIGGVYTYERDVLGRLRKITLPDGNTQTVGFDDFGRVSQISRSNIGNVSYVYDNEHDRLKEKTVLGLRESYEYDSAGRVNSTIYESEPSFLQSMLSLIQLYSPIERYEFSYEGNGVTEVRHSEFTKKFSYAPDDKPELKSLKTKSGLSIDLRFKYDKFRQLEEQKVSDVYVKQFIYDDYRQLGLVKVCNQTFSVERDDLGKISRIILPNNQTFYVDYDSLTQGRLGHSSDLGSYYWGFNDRGLIANTCFTSSSDVCDPKTLNFTYASDRALQEPAFAGTTAATPSSRGPGIYDENCHRIGIYKNGVLDHIRFEGIVRTATHIYEKFSIEGIELGILIDGQFQPCIFDQVSSLIAIGESILIPSAFGERKEYLPIFEYFDYAGQGRDQTTGLIAMGERDYDPRTHQFTSPDRYFLEHPEACVESPEECDLYSYAKNNPLIYTDVDGQMAYWKPVFKAAEILSRAALPYVAASAKSILKEHVKTFAQDFISPLKKATGSESNKIIPLEGTIRVGRWMSEVEHRAMKQTGRMLEGSGGKTYVSTSGPTDFRAAGKGSVYLEFEIEKRNLVPGSKDGWFSTLGPSAEDSQKYRLEKQGGKLLPEFKNLSPILERK